MPTCTRLAILALALSACTRQPTDSADQVRRGLLRALGPGADTVRTLSVDASVLGPNGAFGTTVASTTTGNVRLTLGSSLRAGVYQGRGWLCDSLGRVMPLDSITRTVVRGHDLHTLVLAPSWLAPPTLDPANPSDSLVTLRYQDELGAPLLLHLRRRDTLPVGLSLINHTGQGPREVEVQFADWEELGGIRLFRQAVFLQGGNRFEYTYRTVALNGVPDTALAPACPG